MDPRITLITLGVSDLARAVRFYRDGLGWPMSDAGDGNVAFFRTGGAVLSLWGRDLLAEDANQADTGSGFGGIVLAHNVATREQVDTVLAEAFWGGYTGHFADPDGFPWEVAWNPGFPLREDGSIELP